VPLSATFRNQLERASLCVSNSVAEAFEWMSTGELLSVLKTARDAAVEVQSMVAVVSERPKAARLRGPLQEIRTSAEACARQLGGWKHAIENPGQNKRPGPAGQDPGRPTGTRPQNYAANANAPSGRAGA
jgi:four helix bundle protein